VKYSPLLTPIPPMSNCPEPSHRRWLLAATFLLLITPAVDAFGQRGHSEWGVAFPPFRIAGNLYYVGDQDLAAYLIATPKGLILINSNIVQDVPLIKSSIEKLGFHFSDIRILLISHAHFDHCAGSAAILRQTGAKYFVMDGDVDVVESGGRTDFQYGHDPRMYFPRAKVDRVLHDGDPVELGGVTLVAHQTAGHTKGTTTWTLEESENGETLHVVIVGSPNVNPGYKLVNNPVYPEIAKDYEHGFAVLKTLPCDMFLGAHGGYFDLQEKFTRWKRGGHDAFVDPQGYETYIEERYKAFESALSQQEKR